MEQSKKKLSAIHTFSLREVINTANDYGIQKEDIVDFISKDGEGYYLIYYK